ncbi:MAG TPA: CpsD/CapB family tyrosine-protein kinase [Candidatus Binatia bacterium]|nr:CpsD/CapB family tyrosine-protein kinase [Candidatus Binatia bacterium]
MGRARTQVAGEVQPEVRSVPPAATGGTLLQKLRGQESRDVFSGIYAHLLASANGAQPRTILVCSASVGEGGTFVAAGFALAVAEEYARQVLLIDGNLHHPQVCATFGVADNLGLGDLLAGNADAGTVVQQTAVANLSVLGVGGMCPDHIRALKPPKFHDLLDELAATYKFILIDGPSIQAHPESLLYAPQVDRVFVVTQAGKTRVPVLARALMKLSTAGCDQVEFILNRRTFVIPHSIYKKL